MALILFPALLGAGLVALFVVGLAIHATPWLTWLDGVAAALVIGALASRSGGRSTMNRGAILALAAALLLVLWLVGISGHASRWLVWWTFGAFLAVGLAAFDNGLDGLLDRVRTLPVKARRTQRALGRAGNEHNQSQEGSMYRGVAIALGVGLLVLWLAGLAYHAPVWLTWLDGVGGLVAFVVAWSFVASVMVGVGMSGGLALGLFVLWIIALGSRGGIWMAWWTFGFAAAFSLLAVAAMGSATEYGQRLHHRHA